MTDYKTSMLLMIKKDPANQLIVLQKQLEIYKQINNELWKLIPQSSEGYMGAIDEKISLLYNEANTFETNYYNDLVEKAVSINYMAGRFSKWTCEGFDPSRY